MDGHRRTVLRGKKVKDCVCGHPRHKGMCGVKIGDGFWTCKCFKPSKTQVLLGSLAFIFLLCAGNGRADAPQDKATGTFDVITATDGTVSVGVYQGNYYVFVDTQAWSLYQFIRQGFLCAWRGKHEWELGRCENEKSADKLGDALEDFERPDARQHCKICGRCRKKIKVKEEIERWEE